MYNDDEMIIQRIIQLENDMDNLQSYLIEVGILPTIYIEGVHNRLPSWRPSILPIEMEHDEYDNELTQYAKGSIFRHILDNHKWSNRIIISLIDNDIVHSVNGILSRFNISNVAYDEIRKSIRHKILLNKKLDLIERQIVSYIESMDNKTLFPRHMPDRAIHNAIKQAYSNAHKASKPQRSYEKIIDIDGPILRNAMTYNGYAGNLLIGFVFDFDSNTIRTAYPIYNK